MAPKPGKEHCSEGCKNAFNTALRKWARRAFEGGLVDVETLRRLSRADGACTANKAVLETTP